MYHIILSLSHTQPHPLTIRTLRGGSTYSKWMTYSLIRLSQLLCFGQQVITSHIELQQRLLNNFYILGASQTLFVPSINFNLSYPWWSQTVIIKDIKITLYESKQCTIYYRKYLEDTQEFFDMLHCFLKPFKWQPA